MNSPATAPVSSWIGEFILLAALWGASFLFMRMGAAEFGPVPTAGLRVGLASLFLIPVLLLRGEWPVLRKHWKPAMLSGIINSAIPFALFAYAVMHMATGMTSILNASTPLFGAVIAWLYRTRRSASIAAAIEHVRAYMERNNKLSCASLSGGFEHTGHPFVNGPLGARLDHCKGNRKHAGRSKASDLKVQRREDHWRG